MLEDLDGFLDLEAELDPDDLEPDEPGFEIDDLELELDDTENDADGRRDCWAPRDGRAESQASHRVRDGGLLSVQRVQVHILLFCGDFVGAFSGAFAGDFAGAFRSAFDIGAGGGPGLAVSQTSHLDLVAGLTRVHILQFQYPVVAGRFGSSSSSITIAPFSSSHHPL